MIEANDLATWAREKAPTLSDADWRDAFNDDRPHGPGAGPRAYTIPEAQALLAELDRLWGTLSANAHASLCNALCDLSGIAQAIPWTHAPTLMALRRRALVVPHGCRLTPLGRAMLRRAKENHDDRA